MRNILQTTVVGLILVLLLSPIFDFARPHQLKFTANANAAPLPQQTQTEEQAPDLFLKELQIIHLTNLKRREHGLPPLRWNRELNLAARWFAKNSVTGHGNQSACGHTDSEMRSPGDRFLAFGYRNPHAWGENVICGLTDPQYAVDGWMKSDGHRANLLHTEYREIGVGYYRDDESGRGFIAQDFSVDPTYAPVIIENEAPSTAKSTVNLYIYDPAVGEGLQGMGPAVEMMIANEPDFTDATWEPYTTEKAWQLSEGEGWRTVYVKTRDGQDRTNTVFDTIYLGAAVPTADLDLEQACSYRPRIEIDSLDQTGWPQVQLSLNWQGDDSDTTFQDKSQIGQPFSDADAIGKRAYFMPTGTQSGQVRYWTTSFHKDVPLVAYFRVKATNTTSANPVLGITVHGGGTEYGPLTLKGTDFASADAYQEFAIPFQFNSNSNDPYLIFDFHHTGASDIYLDTISIFTTSMAIAQQVEWSVLGGYHRSRGIWARFVQTDGSFTAPAELQIYGANADLIVPPLDGQAPTEPITQPIAPQPEAANHQLFLPITLQ
jgi:uncharacterized protein YkwD